jgi:hypothetical protein
MAAPFSLIQFYAFFARQRVVDKREEVVAYFIPGFDTLYKLRKEAVKGWWRSNEGEHTPCDLQKRKGKLPAT